MRSLDALVIGKIEIIRGNASMAVNIEYIKEDLKDRLKKREYGEILVNMKSS